VPSRAIRVPLEAVVIAAIGLATAVAGLSAAAVIAVVAVAVMLIALSEFLISARQLPELEPAAVSASMDSPNLEVDEPAAEAAVSERMARAILLSGQPPLPPDTTRDEPHTPPARL
jgi:hypothetical protein